jgi:hypothetical protein
MSQRTRKTPTGGAVANKWRQKGWFGRGVLKSIRVYEQAGLFGLQLKICSRDALRTEEFVI